MYKRILLPLDGSALAEQALPHAIAQAKCFEAELTLLKVLELLPKERRFNPAIIREAFELTDTMARKYLGQVAIRAHDQGIPVRIATVEGQPHGEIIKFAEANEIDLIVISTRGHSGISRWLMGSVADRVVRGATVPVLLVHAPKEQDEPA